MIKIKEATQDAYLEKKQTNMYTSIQEMITYSDFLFHTFHNRAAFQKIRHH